MKKPSKLNLWVDFAERGEQMVYTLAPTPMATSAARRWIYTRLA